MKNKIPMLWRWAVVSQGGMVWTVYDTWASWSTLRTPMLFHPDEEERAREEVVRAKAYSEDDEEFPYNPETVTLAKIHLSLEIPE